MELKNTLIQNGKVILNKEQKSPLGLFFNGGVDAYRFELLVIKYMKNLLDTNTDRICDLIKKLGMIM